MKRFLTGIKVNSLNVDVIDAPINTSIDVSDYDEYIFQYADNKKQAKTQHDIKFEEYCNDIENGLEIKNTY